MCPFSFLKTKVGCNAITDLIDGVRTEDLTTKYKSAFMSHFEVFAKCNNMNYTMKCTMFFKKS